MKPIQNPAASQMKLLFITVLMLVIGLAFVTPFFDKTPYSSDTPQVLIAEIQESSGDSESIVPDPNLAALFKGMTLVFTSIFLGSLHSPHQLTPRLTFLYHIRPRSPPF